MAGLGLGNRSPCRIRARKETEYEDSCIVPS